MGLLNRQIHLLREGNLRSSGVQKNRFDKLLAHDRRRRFDVAPCIPTPLAVQASKPIRHPPLLLEMQHAPKACACRSHTGAAGSGLA